MKYKNLSQTTGNFNRKKVSASKVNFHFHIEFLPPTANLTGVGTAFIFFKEPGHHHNLEESPVKTTSNIRASVIE